jgi:hypothetical protein
VLGCRVEQLGLVARLGGDALLRSGQVAVADRRHLGQLVTVQVLHTERPEHVVDDRVRHLDVGVALHHAAGLEGLEREGVDELLQRHAVLQALRHGDGEAAQDALEGRPSLARSMKISPRVPSSYSPVRRYTLWPPIRASWV